MKNISDTVKKILIVSGLTGLGHILSVALYPIAMRFLSSDKMVTVTLIDSTVMILIGCLGFGLNATATRDIATSSTWRKVLCNTQRARITLSLISCLLGFVLYTFSLVRIEIAVILFFAPLFAINYDFALYGLGKPIAAAVVSFIRQSLPLTIFILCILSGYTSPIIYLILIFISIYFSAHLTSKFAKAKLFYLPSKFFYRNYFGSVLVGVAGLFLIYQRFGFLSSIEGRLSSEDFVFLATTLKILLLVVASKRILIQIFYVKLIHEDYCQKINIFCFSMALLSLILTYLFSSELSQIIFNTPHGQEYIILIGFGACALLSFAVSDSRLLLNKQDRWMFVSGLITGGGFTIIVLNDFSYLTKGVDYLLTLIIIELLLSLSYKLGLKLTSVKNKVGNES